MKAPSRMTFDELDLEYHMNFRATREHYRARTGEEAYQFDIKIQKVDVPELVRSAFSEEQIERKYEKKSFSALEDFNQYLYDNYEWLEDLTTAGRSGGWLILTTTSQVAFVDGIRLAVPRSRIRDLRKIEKDLEAAKYEFKKKLRDPETWGITPRDWSPRWKKS